MPTLLAPPAQTMQGAAARFDPTASCAKMFPLLEKLAGVAPGSYVLSRAAGAQYAVLRKSVEAQDGDRTCVFFWFFFGGLTTFLFFFVLFSVFAFVLFLFFSFFSILLLWLKSLIWEGLSTFSFSFLK